MTDNEIILEALDFYYNAFTIDDGTKVKVLEISSKIAAQVARETPVRPVESLAQLDVYDRVGLRPEALERHKAGHPNADGTMEDTRFHPVDEI